MATWSGNVLQTQIPKHYPDLLGAFPRGGTENMHSSEVFVRSAKVGETLF